MNEAAKIIISINSWNSPQIIVQALYGNGLINTAITIQVNIKYIFFPMEIKNKKRQATL